MGGGGGGSSPEATSQQGGLAARTARPQGQGEQRVLLAMVLEAESRSALQG